MNRLEAIRIVVAHLGGDELMVHANGAISRESYSCRDREKNIYLLGSMGLPAAVGLGIALNQPRHRVVVLDGDGNLLMGFGNLALIGALKPGNLIHFVLDNQAYQTTGGQPSISSHLDLTRVAQAAGYKKTFDIETPEALTSLCAEGFQQPGPYFIRVSVPKPVTQKVPRIPYNAVEMKERFMKSLQPGGSF